MARRTYRIRVRGHQRQPIDADLLAQVVLMLAAERDDLDDEGRTSDGIATTGHGRNATNGRRQR